jgi:hypothetical protein
VVHLPACSLQESDSILEWSGLIFLEISHNLSIMSIKSIVVKNEDDEGFTEMKE